MTSNGMRRVQDLKTISLVIGVTAALASAAWGIVSWAQSMKPRVEATADHEVLHRRITSANESAAAADKHATDVEKKIEPIGRDVKTIKCLMLAPNQKARAKCGLQ